MATDREIYTRAQAGLVGGSSEFAADPLAGGGPTQTPGVARDINRRTFSIIKLAADPAAADNTANGVCNGTFAIQAMVPRKARLVGARLIPQANATASNTTYANINVTKDNGLGGSQTTIFSANTKLTTASGTGNLVVGQMINCASYIVQASDANVVDAGQLLQLQITKASTGVVVPVLNLQLDFEEV